MALKDRMEADIFRVFMNINHFAEDFTENTWNGKPILCTMDNEIALKRKNNNVVDISWDNNRSEKLIYTPVKGFPGRLQPNEHILFNGQSMTVAQYHDDTKMYTILLVSNDAKAVAL